jgi:predicted transcriptional regulator of viral defense system
MDWDRGLRAGPIIVALEANPETVFTVASMATRTGILHGRASCILADLVRRGHAERVSRGRYRLHCLAPGECLGWLNTR